MFLLLCFQNVYFSLKLPTTISTHAQAQAHVTFIRDCSTADLLFFTPGFPGKALAS